MCVYIMYRPPFLAYIVFAMIWPTVIGCNVENVAQYSRYTDVISSLTMVSFVISYVAVFTGTLKHQSDI